MSNTRNGGELMADALVAHGVQTVFCLAGTAHTHLLRALEPRGIRVVSCRHEANVVLAADGYARVSGLTGVALIKSDQGLPNAVTGLYTANTAGTPVVVLSSFAPRSTMEAGGDLHENEFAMASHACKWARIVPVADRLGEYMGTAFRQAREGRRGVALLAFPQEMQSFEVAPEAAVPVSAPAAPPQPETDAVARLAEMVAEAERPLILAGNGAAQSGAGAALMRLARDHGLFVLGNSHGRGLVPEDGIIGQSWPFGQPAAKQADLVIASGIRLTQRVGYGLPPRFGAGATFAQIDIQAEEIGRNRPMDLAIHADAAATLNALANVLDAAGAPPKATGWVSEALAARTARIAELGKDDETGEIHPYRIGRALAEHLPKDAVLVGDGADILNWLHGVYSRHSPDGYMDHYPFGSMGVGTGLALGAAAALDDEARQTGKRRTLALLTGDGAFGFFCGELHSFAQADLPITIIIANDGAWGTEHHGQKKALGASWNCLLGKSAYHHVGTAFGFASKEVAEPGAVDGSIAEALASEGRHLLNVLTDTEAGALRKSDPRVQTVAFEDLVSSLKTHYTPEVE